MFQVLREELNEVAEKLKSNIEYRVHLASILERTGAALQSLDERVQKLESHPEVQAAPVAPEPAPAVPASVPMPGVLPAQQ